MAERIRVAQLDGSLENLQIAIVPGPTSIERSSLSSPQSASHSYDGGPPRAHPIGEDHPRVFSHSHSSPLPADGLGSATKNNYAARQPGAAHDPGLRADGLWARQMAAMSSMFSASRIRIRALSE